MSLDNRPPFKGQAGFPFWDSERVARFYTRDGCRCTGLPTKFRPSARRKDRVACHRSAGRAAASTESRQDVAANRRKEGSGGRGGVRTPDPLLAKQMLSQLSYTPTRWLHCLNNRGQGQVNTKDKDEESNGEGSAFPRPSAPAPAPREAPRSQRPCRASRHDVTPVTARGPPSA